MCQCLMASGWGGLDTHLHCLDVATLDNIDLQRYGGRHLRLLLFKNNVQNKSKSSSLLDLRASGHSIIYFMRGGVFNSTNYATRQKTAAMTCSAQTRNVYFQLANMHRGRAQRTLPHFTLAPLHILLATLDRLGPPTFQAADNVAYRC